MRAEEINWPVASGWGQPEAIVITDGLDVFLMYPTQAPGRIAIPKFPHGESVKYGSPHDEVFDGWTLSRVGVELGGGIRHT